MAVHAFAVGRLVADPEQPTNGPAKFRIAVDDYNRQTKQREASFWDCFAFGKTGETVMKYTGKGRLVAVTGSISKRKYMSSQGGEREIIEIAVESLELLSNGQKPQPQQLASDPSNTSAW